MKWHYRRMLPSGTVPCMAPRLTDRQRYERSLPERDLMASFMEAARLQGWRAMHVNDSRRMVTRGGHQVLVGDSDCKGWPDLFLAHPRSGRLLAVEVKKELGRLTEEQLSWLSDLGACDVETFVLRPSTYDEGLALLRPRSSSAAA